MSQAAPNGNSSAEGPTWCRRCIARRSRTWSRSTPRRCCPASCPGAIVGFGLLPPPSAVLGLLKRHGHPGMAPSTATVRLQLNTHPCGVSPLDSLLGGPTEFGFSGSQRLPPNLKAFDSRSLLGSKGSSRTSHRHIEVPKHLSTPPSQFQY